MSATVNEHIKHEIINSNTSMDNDSTAEGSNDSCSGESNLTKSNNYGFGYVTKHLNDNVNYSSSFSNLAIRNWSKSISIKCQNRRNSGSQNNINLQLTTITLKTIPKSMPKTPPSFPSFLSTSPVLSPLSPSSPLSKSPSRNDCKIIQDHTDLFPGIKPILNTSIEELNRVLG
nr:5554_t:CDS:2 [Entrophospora candida]